MIRNGGRNEDLLLKGAYLLLPEKEIPVKGDITISNGVITDIITGSSIPREIPHGVEKFCMKGCIISTPFFDAHMHYHQWSISHSCVDLTGCTGENMVLSRLKDVEGGRTFNLMYEGSGFLIGVDMDDSHYNRPISLNKKLLNRNFPDTPVLIRRVCGHVAYANEMAMDHLDISDKGKESGVLLENDSMSSISQLSPKGKQLQDILITGKKYLLSKGVVGGLEIIHERDLKLFWDEFKNMGGGLKLVFSLVGESNKIQGSLKNKEISWSDPPDLEMSTDNPGPVAFKKIFMDGSIGAETASFEEPYVDGTKIEPLLTREELDNILSECKELGLVPMIHAIGDRAISDIVDVAEKDQCIRIEHAEGINTKLIEKIEKKNISLCIQPNFQIRWGSEGGLYETRLGKRGLTLNPLEEIIGSKVPTCFGTDMMPPDPMYALYRYCFISNIIQHQKKQMVMKMFRGFTTGSRKLSFVNGYGKGGLLEGEKADLMVIEQESGKIIDTVVGGYRMGPQDNT